MMEYWATRSSTPLLHHSIYPNLSHSHNIVSSIDMHHFAGDGAAPITAKIERGLADFFRADVALERRALGDVMQHGFEIGDAAAARVRSGPAEMALTRIPFGPRSCAR